MLPPIIILGSLGLLFGVGLFIASRLFRVHVDTRVVRIEHVLPGANCGACGLPGCSGFAKALIHGSAEIDGCTPGGADVTGAIADIMGVEVKLAEKKVAVLRCRGRDVEDRYEYDGVRSCAAAVILQGGPKLCSFGCIGYADCVDVCPFDALHMVDGIPEVDEEKCTGCGKCANACPKGLFEMRPMKDLVHVCCLSEDSGKITRGACAVGCIGCRKCEKVCKFGAITIVNNLAIFDYEKCTSCGLCVKECPTGSILNFRKDRKVKGLLPIKKSAPKVANESAEQEIKES